MPDGRDAFMTPCCTWCVFVAAAAVATVVLLAWSASFFRRRFSLDGRVVVVTGAASGIGRRLCEVIIARSRPASLLLLDVDEDALARLKSALQQQAEARPDNSESGHSKGRVRTDVRSFKCDVSDERSVGEVVDRIEASISPRHIDVLVNNAGIVNGASVDTLTSAQIRRVLEVNALGQMWMIKAVLPGMKKAPGDSVIVSVASVMGLISGANLADYCASKAAVCAFLDCLRLELWRDGFQRINTLLVCPNAVDTGMFRGIMEGETWPAWLSRLLLPMSTDMDAAERIYTAITRREQLVVSCYTGWRGVVVPWLPAVSRLLPVSLYDFVVFLGGAVDGMDTFVGRQKDKQA
ncbi:hypothetical protein PINS_up005445 [Pythium insidiosum]|nr:hypothetical protein PINS_up005445 [Pythium insidiosum]